MKYIKLIRVHHWVKNGLIFIPLLFSGMFLKENYLFETIIGTISFCFLASFIYIINDLNDVEKDRLHEKKKYRPIASGAVTVNKAKVLAVMLLIIAFVLNLLIARFNIAAWIAFLAYLVINLLYSIAGWKNIPLLDIVLLVSGFYLRVLYGAVLTYIDISAWLYLVIISGAFYLGFGKRRNELMKSKENTREVLKSYSFAYLDKNLNSCMTLAIAFFSLWCIEKNEMSNGDYNYLITVPILMIIFFKYALNLEDNSSGDPVEVILHDKVLLVLIFIFVGILALLTYSG